MSSNAALAASEASEAADTTIPEVLKQLDGRRGGELMQLIISKRNVIGPHAFAVNGTPNVLGGMDVTLWKKLGLQSQESLEYYFGMYNRTPGASAWTKSTPSCGNYWQHVSTRVLIAAGIDRATEDTGKSAMGKRIRWWRLVYPLASREGTYKTSTEIMRELNDKAVRRAAQGKLRDSRKREAATPPTRAREGERLQARTQIAAAEKTIEDTEASRDQVKEVVDSRARPNSQRRSGRSMMPAHERGQKAVKEARGGLRGALRDRANRLDQFFKEQLKELKPDEIRELQRMGTWNHVLEIKDLEALSNEQVQHTYDKEVRFDLISCPCCRECASISGSI